jgi:hypothetical protein
VFVARAALDDGELLDLTELNARTFNNCIGRFKYRSSCART